MTFTQFLYILNYRKYSIIFILVLTISSSVALSQFLPKTYKATAQVILNMKGVDLVTDGSVRLPTNTHVGIIQSRKVAVKVVENLGLSSQQRYISSFLKANVTGNLDINNFIAEDLRGNLSIGASRRNLGVISITYESSSPTFSASVANAYIDAYIQTVLEMNNETPERTAFWFGKEVETYKQDYEKALNDLNAYRDQEKIYDLSEFEFEKEFLTQLNSQLFDADKQLNELTMKVKSIKPDLSNYSDVIEDGTLESIRVDVMKAQAAFYRKVSILDKNHPEYKKLSQQLISIRSFLKSETKSSYERLLRKKESLQTTIASLQIALESQQNKISSLTQRFNQLNELQLLADEAMHKYSNAKKRLNQLELQAKSSASESEISVLTNAIEPASAEKTKALKLIILSVPLAFILALGYAMLRELVNRRIRIDDDVTTSVGLPVVGHIIDGNQK